MARVQYKSTPGGVLTGRTAGGVLYARKDVTIVHSGGTVYAASTGATPYGGPLKTNIDGEVPGWLDEGLYTTTDPITGESITFEVGGGGSGLATRVDSLESDSGVVAKKAAATVVQHVDGFSGDDAKDGRSWGTAKLSPASALALMPDGGPIRIASGDPYNVAATLAVGGITLDAIARGAGATRSQAVLRHMFNGNLIDFGSKGGALRNLKLFQDEGTAGRTGAAIIATSSASVGGGVVAENVVISGGDGWERNVVLNGSAWASGIRTCDFVNLGCFGCRTAGETIVITKGVYCTFLGGFVVPSPTAVTQGIKVLDGFSTGVKFLGFSMIGDFYTEAAGSPLGVLYVGDISGNVVCASTARNNIFIGTIGGTFDDGGHASNRVIGSVGGAPRTPDTAKAQTWVGRQTFQGNPDVLGILGGTTTTFAGLKRLVMAGGGNGADGLVELYTRMAVASAYGFYGFPDPGAGAAFIEKGVLMDERTDPAAPAANRAFLYTRDNGAGKTQVCVRFPTGAVQVIATEP